MRKKLNIKQCGRKKQKTMKGRRMRADTGQAEDQKKGKSI